MEWVKEFKARDDDIKDFAAHPRLNSRFLMGRNRVVIFRLFAVVLAGGLFVLQTIIE